METKRLVTYWGLSKKYTATFQIHPSQITVTSACNSLKDVRRRVRFGVMEEKDFRSYTLPLEDAKEVSPREVILKTRKLVINDNIRLWRNLEE